ncbi:MAG: T9SS type A sorting domain-containing protein [Ignavibacteria bacterium]|nr:T9SS type A sorting domain-containing protein [Ignavibacteria bacterium]
MLKSKINPILSGKKLILIISLFILTAITTYAQAPDTQWTKTYGGSQDDRGYCVKQTFDGGFIILGTTNSFGTGGISFILLKTDFRGDTLWTRTYQGSYDNISMVEQTSDSGYIIIGMTELFGSGMTDLYLIKTNSYGDSLWAKTYGGCNLESGVDGQQTSDGGYIITGCSKSFGTTGTYVYLIKTDSLGDCIWTRTYEDGFNGPYRVTETTDEGFLVAGETSFPIHGGETDIYLIKTNSSGDTLWTKKHGGTSMDEVWDIQQTSDGGYFIVSTTRSFGMGWWDYYLIKTDEFGDTLWTKTFGGEFGDGARSGHQTSDGGYIVSGWACSFGNYYQAYLVKTNSQGDKLWDKIYGGFSQDESQFIQQTSDGGYISVGGTRTYGAGNWDIWLIKIAPDTLLTSVKNEHKFVSDYRLFQSYPNPFNPVTTIKYQIPKSDFVTIKVYDVLGKEVATLVTKKQDEGSYEIKWNASEYPSGVYFCKLTTEDYTNVKKMLLIK